MMYKIVVQYVDFPMGASPEYIEHSGMSKVEADKKIKELRELAEKNSPNNACNYPVYTIKEDEEYARQLDREIADRPHHAAL